MTTIDILVKKNNGGKDNTQRMGMLHSYINPSVTRNVQSGKRKKKRLDVANIEVRSQVSVPSMPHDMSEIQVSQPSLIRTLIDEAQKNDIDGTALIDFVANYIQVEVIA